MKKVIFFLYKKFFFAFLSFLFIFLAIKQSSFDLVSTISLVIATVLFYGIFIETKIIKVKKFQIQSQKIKKPILAVFVSDIHAGFGKSLFLARVVKKINNLKPDIVLVGGDSIEGGSWDTKFLQPLAKLKANYPPIAVLGNHDYELHFPSEKPNPKLAKKVANQLKSIGFKVLRNEILTINHRDNKINIIGLDDLWAKKANQQAVKKINPKYFTLTLSHNPDIIFSLNHKPDLLLTGHTHGFTLRWPLGKPIFPIFKNTQLAAEYSKGFFKLKGVKTVVSSGVGEPVIRLFFNFPEIIVIELLPNTKGVNSIPP